MYDPFFRRRSKLSFLLPSAHIYLTLQYLNPPLSVHKIVTCNISFFYVYFLFHKILVLHHLTGNFLHQLTARFHTLQLISNYFNMKVVAFKHLDDFLYIPLYTILERSMRRNVKSRTADIVSLCSASLVLYDVIDSGLFLITELSILCCCTAFPASTLIQALT